MEHADYEKAAKEILTDALAGKYFPLPRLNTPTGKLMQRYALLRIFKSRVDRMHEEARAAVLVQCSVPLEPGTHPVFDSPHVFAQATVREGPRRLNEGAVVDMLKERFDIDEEQAQALVEGCKSGKSLPVAQLTVTLKK